MQHNCSVSESWSFSSYSLVLHMPYFIITLLLQEPLTGHGKLFHEQRQKGKGNYNKFLNMVWWLDEVGIFIYIPVFKDISFKFLKMKNSMKQLMKK